MAKRLIAAANAAVLVTASMTLAISNGPTQNTHPLSGPISHLDGRLVFGQDTTQVTRTNLFADTSLYALNPRGGSIERLTHQADGIYQAVASPDGRRIAYSQQTYGRGPAGHPTHVNGSDVRLINADGSNDHLVYRCPYSACESLVWSPDSTHLLINGNRILQPDGSVTPLCVGPCAAHGVTSDASWSPDSEQLAFDYQDNDVPLDNGRSGPAGNATVYGIGVMNADGSDPKLITDNECRANDLTLCSSDGSPMWAPHDDVIAFTREPVNYLRPNSFYGSTPLSFGPGRIYTIRPDGSDLQLLTDCGSSCSIQTMAWSPSGRALAFVSYYEGPHRRQPPWTLSLVDLQSRVRDSEPLRIISDNSMADFAWAPSGTRIVIGQRSYGGERPKGIYVVTVNDGSLGPLQLLVPNGLPPITWLPRARQS